MKILLIHNYYQYWGGEDSYFTSLIKLLKDNGHEVILYTKNSKDIDKHNIWQKLKISIGMFWNREVEKELTELIKRFKPNIAQFQNIFPLISPTAYIICKQYKIPIIQRISNYRFLCPKGTLFQKGKICERCLSKKFAYPSIIYRCYQQSYFASIIFSTSFFFHNLIKTFDSINMYIFPINFIRDYFLKNFSSQKEQTIVIPTFVDIPLLQKNTKIKENNYFLYVGRLSEEKGILPLLELFAISKQLKLMVIGAGPLEDKVQKYKKYPNIYIKGFMSREEIIDYMKKALAIIIPSLWYDVLPNVLIESMFLKIPVIIPKSEIFIEFVKKDKNVFFYKNLLDLKRSLIKIFYKNKNIKKRESYINKNFLKKINKEKNYSLLMEEYTNLTKKNKHE